MELKVWVGGIQRIVCGVTSETTCQDIIMALAHATGQTGGFVLLEQWKEHEKYLLPGDKPLEILEKWGEYASGVRFILRKSRNGTSTNTHHEEDEAELSCDTTASDATTGRAARAGTTKRTDIRSPGSGSSTITSPQSSLRRGSKGSMTEFTKRIVESGGVEDLVKFVALQRERLQLLKEEAELLDGETHAATRYTELDQLKQREHELDVQIQQLSHYDRGIDDIQQLSSEIHPTIVTELQDEKLRMNDLVVKIENENSKVEKLAKEIEEENKEVSRMELLEQERNQELEKLKMEVENSRFSLVRSEEKLNEVLNDLGKCVDQVRLREGVLQDLKMVLKSSS